MPFERLAIPLYTNPARQKFWRAVGLFGLITTAVILGYGLDRAVHYRSSTEHWPTDAVMSVRVIKTPRTIKLIENNLGETQLLPGGPWDITEALTWSKREFIVYTDADTVIGVKVDGKLSIETESALVTWGWKPIHFGSHTLIVKTDAAEPLPATHHVNLWLTLPIFDGSLTLAQADNHFQSIPYRFSSAHSLDFPVNMEKFIPTSRLALTESTNLLGSFKLSSAETAAFLPTNVSGSFPGLQLLEANALTNGFDLLLGVDDTGPAFTASTSPTKFSLEDLGAIATEGLSLQNLSTSVLTSDDFPTSLEIRSSAAITVDVNTADNLASAVAKNGSGQLFRLTQSQTQLILSNRPTVIGLNSAELSNTCLNHPAGFIKPHALSELVPNLSTTLGHGLAERLMTADQIAFRKNRLRICW